MADGTLPIEASDRRLKLQSGFRKGHSTEMVLLKLISDAIDSNCVTLLAHLDVNEMFNMVNQDILIKNLSTSYGIGG